MKVERTLLNQEPFGQLRFERGNKVTSEKNLMEKKLEPEDGIREPSAHIECRILELSSHMKELGKMPTVTLNKIERRY